jgi:hypothetical protein
LFWQPVQPAGVFGSAQVPPDPPELEPELDPDEDPELLPELPPDDPPLEEPPEDPLDEPLEEPLDPPLLDPESMLPPSSGPASPNPWKMLVAPPQWVVSATTPTTTIIPSEPGQRNLAPIASPSLRTRRTSTGAAPRPTCDCYFPA